MKLQIILFLLISFHLNGQIENQKQMKIGYYGDMILHSGVKISYEKYIYSKEKSKGDKVKLKSILMGADLLYYSNANHHHGFAMGPSIIIQKSKANGSFTQWKLMIGVLRSIVDGTTFEVGEDNQISQVKLAGQTAFYNSLSFQFGRPLNQKIKYYVELGINGRTPYNHSYLIGIHSSFGIQFSIN